MNASTSDACPAHAAAALRGAVEDAYRIFSPYSRPSLLDMCGYCCVSEVCAQRLREWPLKRLTAEQFNEYNGSAKSQVQAPREVGHFLPRMLDLMAQGREIHHSIELSLDRLGRCPEGSWNDAEREVLDRFAAAYFALILRSGPLGAGLSRWMDDPLSVLLMFDIGGLSIEPLLAMWLACDHPLSTIQYVDTTYWHFWDGQQYTNAFATDRPAFRERIRAWLLDPVNKMRFMDRLLAPDFQEQAATCEPGRHMPFPLMVDGVFDCLAQRSLVTRRAPSRPSRTPTRCQPACASTAPAPPRPACPSPPAPR